MIIKSLGPLPFSEENSIEEVDGAAHGAEPSTEEISKDHHEKEHAKAWEHPEDDILLGQNRDESDEGVETEVEINRELQFKGKCGFKNQIEKKTERKNLNCLLRVGITLLMSH